MSLSSLKVRGVKIHFVGIGGVGMSGLAEILFKSGSVVRGSDLKETLYTKRLKKLGIHVFYGHNINNIGSAEIVVQSSAVPEDNVEICFARKNGIPIIKRYKALAEVMRLKRGLVVAGTHGKTTTTHFLVNLFIHSAKDPTVVMGGYSYMFNSTARVGKGEWFIAESDESDGGFKYLAPEIAVLTNIDKDHLDYYGSFEKLKSAFLEFILKVPFYGSVVVWGDDPELRELIAGIHQKVIFYGFNEDSDFRLKKIGSLKYEVFIKKKKAGVMNLPLPGRMNALNALAAVTAAMTAGIDFESCVSCFQNFKGAARRFQEKGSWKNVLFYDDYAHHPTEIKALLSAFRDKFGKNKKLIVLFEPHRFSRTLSCWKDFLTCFDLADKVYLMDIYPASEKPIKNVTAVKLAEEIQHKDSVYLPSDKIVSAPVEYLSRPENLKKESVFVTMGAGSVYRYGENILQNLLNLKRK